MSGFFSQLPLLSLFVFVLIGSITPGPNNSMLASSAAVFGWRASLRHALGVVTGAPLACILMSFFLGSLQNLLPYLSIYMKAIGLLIVLYFSFRLIYASYRTSHSKSDNRKDSFYLDKPQPMGYFTALFFQLVNPKLWSVAIAISAGYIVPEKDIFSQSVLVGFMVFLASLPAVSLWLFVGKLLSDVLGGRLFWLNTLLAILMFGTILMIYLG